MYVLKMLSIKQVVLLKVGSSKMYTNPWIEVNMIEFLAAAISSGLGVQLNKTTQLNLLPMASFEFKSWQVDFNSWSWLIFFLMLIKWLSASNSPKSWMIPTE